MTAHLRNAVEWLLLGLLRHLPVTWVSALGACVGELEVRLAAARGRIWVQRFYRNVPRLCGVSAPSELRRCLRHYGRQVGRVYAEYAVLQKIVRQGRVTVEGLDEVLASDRPAILVGPHLANWELLALAAEHIDRPLAAIYEPRENSFRMRAANRARRAWSSRLTLLSSREPDSLRRFVANLEHGYNWLFIDEERDGFVWAPSLGRPLPEAGNRWLAARLAVRFDVDLIPCYVERIGPVRFRVNFHPRLSPAGSGDKLARTRALAAELDHLLDAWVRANPLDWYWLLNLNLDKPLPGAVAAQSHSGAQSQGASGKADKVPLADERAQKSLREEA